MSVTGQPGGPPTKAGTSVGDITGGLFTAVGVASALYHRERTGDELHASGRRRQALIVADPQAFRGFDAQRPRGNAARNDVLSSEGRRIMLARIGRRRPKDAARLMRHRVA